MNWIEFVFGCGIKRREKKKDDEEEEIRWGWL
jgi:hypothetical protein